MPWGWVKGSATHTRMKGSGCEFVPFLCMELNFEGAESTASYDMLDMHMSEILCDSTCNIAVNPIYLVLPAVWNKHIVSKMMKLSLSVNCLLQTIPENLRACWMMLQCSINVQCQHSVTIQEVSSWLSIPMNIIIIHSCHILRINSL